jgi:hypothetical protein
LEPEQGKRFKEVNPGYLSQARTVRDGAIAGVLMGDGDLLQGQDVGDRQPARRERRGLMCHMSL